MDRPTFEAKIRVAPAPIRAAALIPAAVAAMFVSALLGKLLLAVWAILAAALVVFDLVRWLVFIRPYRDVGRLVRVTDGVLTVDGRKAFDQVTTAYFQPRNGSIATVRVRGNRFDTVDVLTADEGQARELLAALGIDPARSITRFRVRQGFLANKGAQMALSVFVGVGAYQLVNLLPHSMKLTGIAVVAALTLLNALPSTVLVGPDGVLVRSPTGLRTHFHAFADIAAATETQWGVKLEMKSGRHVELRTQAEPKAQDETRAALLTRIHAGIAALASAEPSVADVTALVSRGARPIDTWFRALEGMSNRAMGYRAATVPTETLWRVVEDPAADPTARAGAAVALRSSLDAEGRARLHTAAQESVHPKVRVALTAVADETEDARLLDVLEACDEDGSRSNIAGS